MQKIAITGNIAAGKSTVCKIIASMGYPLISCDDIAHDVLELPVLIQAFRRYGVVENDRINRSKLGKLVFADPAIKADLEDSTHPLIFEELSKFFECCKDKDMAFVEIPLLFETATQDQFDVIILVYTNDDIRTKRLMQRNGCTKDEANARINSQLSQDSKVPKSTFVIYNNDDNPAGIKSQIQNILKTISQRRS